MTRDDQHLALFGLFVALVCIVAAFALYDIGAGVLALLAALGAGVFMGVGGEQ